jgi:hypothetical protein
VDFVLGVVRLFVGLICVVIPVAALFGCQVVQVQNVKRLGTVLNQRAYPIPNAATNGCNQ